MLDLMPVDGHVHTVSTPRRENAVERGRARSYGLIERV